MMQHDRDRPDALRRRLLGGAVALGLAPVLPVSAAPFGLPDIPELVAMLGGRTPKSDRLTLELPRIADDGYSVPARIALSGPFAAGVQARTIALFSERNPVRTMFVFDYSVGPPRIEIETRVRLNGTQRIVAAVLMSDDTFYTAVAEVVVASSACIDGT
jgi:sulfur-oxidizing protein SoxY